MLWNAVCSFAGAALGAALAFFWTVKRKKRGKSIDPQVIPPQEKADLAPPISFDRKKTTSFIERVEAAKAQLEKERRGG